MNTNEFTILIPCYNEERNIETLFILCEELQNACKYLSLEFLFIQNGSTDNTPTLLKTALDKYGSRLKGEILELPKNLGLGFGLKSGFMALPNRFICIIPADGKYSVLDITELLHNFNKLRNPYAMCKGMRVNRNDPVNIQVLSFVYTAWCNLLYRTKVKDVNGLPKIFWNTFTPAEIRNLSNSACIDGSLIGLWSIKGGSFLELNVTFTQKNLGSTSWRGKRLKTSLRMFAESYSTSRSVNSLRRIS